MTNKVKYDHLKLAYKFLRRIKEVAKNLGVKIDLSIYKEILIYTPNVDFLFFSSIDEFKNWIENPETVGYLVGIIVGDDNFINNFKRIVEKRESLDVNFLIIRDVKKKYIEAMFIPEI